MGFIQRTVLILSLSLIGKLPAQVYYVISDSTALYESSTTSSPIVRYVHWNDTVHIIKKTKINSIIVNENVLNRETLFSTWTLIQTSHGKQGWLPFNQLTKKIIPPPAKTLGVDEGDKYQDELYPIGWSKNAFAYIVEGYIDGAVDGLTVRYELTYFDGQPSEKTMDYTGYTDPVECMWKQKGFDIQHSLIKNKIIPLSKPVELNRSKILINNKDTLHLYWDMKNYPIKIQASAGGIEKSIHSIEQNVLRINVLGWLANPYDANKIIVLLAYMMESTGHYLEVVPVDLRQFSRKK